VLALRIGLSLLAFHLAAYGYLHALAAPWSMISMRILSLDDEPAQETLIDEILPSEGHQVHIVNDGNQAIRLLETNLVDLILLDCHVPGISGLDVLGWIRERIDRELPVLFLTNRTREDELVAEFNAGADD